MNHDQQSEPLTFIANISDQKPENIIHAKNDCPFCDTQHLTNILNQEGDRIWLENKYKVIEHALQTVIIESDNHLGDPSNYTQTENRKIFAFALKCWAKMRADPKYKSVLMYKNYGPYGGGSLRHPHFQVVGLEKINGYAAVYPKNFVGTTIWKNAKVTVNISDFPIMGFLEFNVLLGDEKQPELLADSVQTIIAYVLKDYANGFCNSYNLFFYIVNGQITCKITPRFTVSPYYAGYKISQNFDRKRIEDICSELRPVFQAQARKN